MLGEWVPTRPCAPIGHAVASHALVRTQRYEVSHSFDSDTPKETSNGVDPRRT